jgi:hypothetical protein
MSNHTYRDGERVKVVIEGTILNVTDDGARETIYVTTGAGATHPGHRVYIGIAGSDKGVVSITRLDPANWPPQAGDIWKGNGLEWFATSDGHLTPDTGEEDWHVSDFKNLNPYLVRRRGE